MDSMHGTIMQLLMSIGTQLPLLAALAFFLVVAFTRFGKDRGAALYVVAAILMMFLLITVPTFHLVFMRRLVDALDDNIRRTELIYRSVGFLTSFFYACPWVLVTIGIMLGPTRVEGKPR